MYNCLRKNLHNRQRSSKEWNFRPIRENDRFEIQTFFPWGAKSGENIGSRFLNTEYGIVSSGYDLFVAKGENETFGNIPVARKDTNIIRIIRMKNGIGSMEDHKIVVPENNTIELTYNY